MRRVLFAIALLVATAHGAKHRRTAQPSPLPGSHESMVRQNDAIDRLQLPRIVDAAQLQQLIEATELVHIDSAPYLTVSVPRVTGRYCRPWTLTFLRDAGRDYYAQFGKPLVVTSAVRTVEEQRILRGRNSNAAPETGNVTSSHLAGISIDIGRGGMNAKQRKWFIEYLRRLRDAGRIEVAMELHQACFHVAVMPEYERLN